MSESVILTKSVNGDYLIVVSGIYNYSKPFPRMTYYVSYGGIKLNPCVGPEIMFKFYLPEEWTINGVTGFTTNKEVTDAITQLASGLNPSPPPNLPDGLITTMNGDSIILSVGGDYVLTVNGFIPMNALMLPNGDYLKTMNNRFITT